VHVQPANLQHAPDGSLSYIGSLEGAGVGSLQLRSAMAACSAWQNNMLHQQQ
jgi:hypothetical protein